MFSLSPDRQSGLALQVFSQVSLGLRHNPSTKRTDITCSYLSRHMSVRHVKMLAKMHIAYKRVTIS